GAALVLGLLLGVGAWARLRDHPDADPPALPGRPPSPVAGDLADDVKPPPCPRKPACCHSGPIQEHSTEGSF
ncbi:MAG: hypothetical protein K2V38_03735, partial [Gemmataceae bacterium]|nr:hypothetical protein [Gemmataceae bacterium]